VAHRIASAAQQVDRGHDLAGLTEAALRYIEVQPRLLYRVQRVAVGEPCDAIQMSITTSPCGREQQIRTFPSAGGSSGSGW